MNSIIKITLLCVLSLGLEAQDLNPSQNPNQVKEAFVKMNSSVQSFASEFKQTKEFSFMDKALISSGQFYYQKSDRLRWEYTSPLEYIMLIKGENIKVKEAGTVKTYSSSVNEVFKTVKEIILGCISGDILSDPNYGSSYFQSNDTYQVKLIPKDKQLQDYMQEINIFLDRESNELSYLLLKDGSGDMTKIEFLNRKINQTISEGTFSEF